MTSHLELRNLGFIEIQNQYSNVSTYVPEPPFLHFFFFIGNAYLQIRSGMLPNFLVQMWSECCLSEIGGCLFSSPRC